MLEGHELRVVLDSNIYLSAIVFGGRPRQLIQLAEEDGLRLLISEIMRREVESVLARKFRYSAREISRSCDHIWKIVEQIQPKSYLQLCRDPFDDRVLECALDGNARFIVTGDRDLLELSHSLPFEILKAEAFLDRLRHDQR